MNKQFLTALAAVFLLSQPAVAKAKTDKTDKAALSVATAAEPIESVVPELSEIVVLCAQDEKKKFEKEWSKYVSEHDLKGVKLKETIAWVSEEAATQRKKTRKKGNKEEDEAWLEERRRLMSEIADKALNPAR